MSASFPQNLMSDLKGSIRIFVETGTSEGDTVATAIKCGFQKIFSVEFNKAIYEKAAARFRDESSVEIYHYDSVSFLAQLLKRLDEPVMFFLDAHPDCDVGVSPVLDELDVILKYPDKVVIVIDDMRLMGMRQWSESSVDALIGKIQSTTWRKFLIQRMQNEHLCDRGDLLVAIEITGD